MDTSTYHRSLPCDDWLTPQEKEVINKHARLLLREEKIEPLWVSHVHYVINIPWLATVSCCDGHEPRYRGYIYYRVTESHHLVLEHILREITDLDENFLTQKNVDYRKGRGTVHYIFNCPQKDVPFVTSQIQQRLDIFQTSNG